MLMCFLGRFTTADSEIYQRVKFIVLSVSNSGWMVGIRFIGTSLPESVSREDDRVSELSNEKFFQIWEISVLRQEFTRHVNEKGLKKTNKRETKKMFWAKSQQVESSQFYLYNPESQITSPQGIFAECDTLDSSEETTRYGFKKKKNQAKLRKSNRGGIPLLGWIDIH